MGAVSANSDSKSKHKGPRSLGKLPVTDKVVPGASIPLLTLLR
jgi:hypothetical protein